MSAQTYKDLEEALYNHVIDEKGYETLLVRDWAVVAATFDIESDEDLTEICIHRSAGTTLYAIAGLLDIGKQLWREVEL